MVYTLKFVWNTCWDKDTESCTLIYNYFILFIIVSLWALGCVFNRGLI